MLWAKGVNAYPGHLLSWHRMGEAYAGQGGTSEEVFTLGKIVEPDGGVSFFRGIYNFDSMLKRRHVPSREKFQQNS